jgi:crotonobetainyl-CoA:carnitine CoA-transferase CaiB-like acyl-CoA transferase
MRLDGIRVLDLTRLLPGPYATQLLADAGADVVKVEDTGSGDYARSMPPMRETEDGSVGGIFDAVNRGKRSVALDLKSEGGLEAFHDLAAEADAVIESFRPGVVDRLGVGYEDVREHNPEVVYCSLTGYGNDSSEADRVGHDLNYVGRAGLLDMTRESPDDDPVTPGYQVADLGGGLFAAFAVIGGLLSRELGDGTGEYIDVAMADVVLSFGQAVATPALDGGDPRPGGTPLAGAYPWYDSYEAADGNYVTIAALEPGFWEAFCEAVDREDLIGAHMTDDAAERAALRDELAGVFAGRTREEWVAAFGDVDGMVDGVYTPAEAVDLASFRERGMVRGERPRLGFPAVGDLPDTEESVPGQGEHTGELLREAGYDAERIESLRESGAVL